MSKKVTIEIWYEEPDEKEISQVALEKFKGKIADYLFKKGAIPTKALFEVSSVETHLLGDL